MIVHEECRAQNSVWDVQRMNVLLNDPFALKVLLPHTAMRRADRGIHKMLNTRGFGSIANVHELRHESAPQIKKHGGEEISSLPPCQGQVTMARPWSLSSSGRVAGLRQSLCQNIATLVALHSHLAGGQVHLELAVRVGHLQRLTDHARAMAAGHVWQLKFMHC